MNKKYAKVQSTRRSLIMSTISLVLCFAMLLGTTYAWFTDEVTSGVNKIIAGNLDVELYHQSKKVSETKVTETTENLFKDVELWEPGAYAYETFTVKNEGNLALKYKMALNVAAFTSYNGHNLTEVLKVAVSDTAPADRAAAAALTGYTALKDWSYTGGASDTTLEKDASKSFTVVLYWEPTDNDNDFNMNNGRPQPLSVDLGVKLVATQVEHEFDSFDNQYDHDADNTLPEAAKVESAMAAATAVAGQPTVFTASIAPAMNSVADTTKVEIDDDALTAGAYNLNVKTTDLPSSIDFEPQGNFTVAAAEGVTTASTAKVATIKLNLVDENGDPAFTAAADGKKAKITTKIAAGLANVGVGYSGTATAPEITEVTYNSATGELSFCTNHFSDYYAVGDGAAYNMNTCATYGTLQEAVTALTADNTVMLLKNVEENILVQSGKNLTIDLNGFTINGKKVNQSPAVKNRGTLVITDTSKSGTGKIMREDKNGDGEPYYVVDNQGVMTIEKANVYNEAKNSTGGATLIRSGIGTSPALTINDGTFINKNYAVVKNEEGSLTINGGVFDSGSQFTAVQIFGNAVINGGSFSKGITKETNGTLVINGGNFKYIPSYVGEGSFMIVDKSKSFDESYQYQVRLSGNEPTEYDAKVVKDTGAVTFYIGKTHAAGANSAQEAHAAGYTVYYNYAPTNVKKLGNGSFYAWYKDGIVKDGHYSADAGYEVLSETNAETGIVRYYTAITENTAIAKIVRNSENLYFSSVVNAAKVAQADETIVVLKDDSATARVVGSTAVPDRISVDLNGKTVAGVLTSNKDNKSITVVDSVGGGVATNAVNNYLDTTSVTIKGGKFTNYIFAQKGIVTIEGGYFTGDLAEKQYSGLGYTIGDASNNGKLVIKGGTFAKDPTAFVADGYAAVSNGDGTWTVQANAK